MKTMTAAHHFLSQSRLAHFAALLLALTAALLAGRALAGDEGVYGPAAPPDSAFIRVFNATQQPAVDARIADKVFQGVAAYGASEFVFLSPGPYSLSIGSQSSQVSLQKGRVYTAVLKDDGIKMIENERFNNRLKSAVILYNLVDGKSLALKTADGSKAVVDAVPPNAAGSRVVNAVKINSALYDGEAKVADVKPAALERGKAFSLFVAGNADSPVTVWVVN